MPACFENVFLQIAQRDGMRRYPLVEIVVQVARDALAFFLSRVRQKRRQFFSSFPIRNVLPDALELLQLTARAEYWMVHPPLPHAPSARSRHFTFPRACVFARAS